MKPSGPCIHTTASWLVIGSHLGQAADHRRHVEVVKGVPVLAPEAVQVRRARAVGDETGQCSCIEEAGEGGEGGGTAGVVREALPLCPGRTPPLPCGGPPCTMRGPMRGGPRRPRVRPRGGGGRDTHRAQPALMQGVIGHSPLSLRLHAAAPPRRRVLHVEVGEVAFPCSGLCCLPSSPTVGDPVNELLHMLRVRLRGNKLGSERSGVSAELAPNTAISLRFSAARADEAAISCMAQQPRPKRHLPTRVAS